MPSWVIWVIVAIVVIAVARGCDRRVPQEEAGAQPHPCRGAARAGRRPGVRCRPARGARQGDRGQGRCARAEADRKQAEAERLAGRGTGPPADRRGLPRRSTPSTCVRPTSWTPTWTPSATTTRAPRACPTAVGTATVLRRRPSAPQPASTPARPAVEQHSTETTTVTHPDGSTETVSDPRETRTAAPTAPEPRLHHRRRAPPAVGGALLRVALRQR